MPKITQQGGSHSISVLNNNSIVLTLKHHPPSQETKSQVPRTHAPILSAYRMPKIIEVAQHLFHCYQVTGKNKTDLAYKWLGQQMTV